MTRAGAEEGVEERAEEGGYDRGVKISVVIPVRDESRSLRTLTGELRGVGARSGMELEIVLVDDGSEDDSWEEIVRLAEEDERIRGARLERWSGKSAALEAGMALSRGEVIVTMDADLQDDAGELPVLLKKLEEGYDLVVGWRRARRDSVAKRVMSAAFNAIVSKVSGLRLHDHNCGFKVMRRGVAESMWLERGMHRFMPAMAHAAGHRVAEAVVEHRARRYGKSKYGISRPFKAAYDLMRLAARTRFFTRAAARGERAETYVAERVGFGSAAHRGEGAA